MAGAIGYLLAIPLSFTSDQLAAHYTRRNHYIREAEMRLGALLPAMIIAPAGLVVYGLTGEHNLHWIGYFFGMAMMTWGGYFYFTFTLAYAVDSHNASTSEMLIAMNMGKTAISFGMSFELLTGISRNGYATIIAGVFAAVLFANNFAVVAFMIWGKRIRIWHSKSLFSRIQSRGTGRENPTAEEH